MSDTPKKAEGNGYTGARIAIVGASPSMKDIENGKAFSDFKVGSGINEYLKESLISRGDIWFTCACKQFVPPDKTEERKIPFDVRAKMAGIDLITEYNNLATELDSIRPNLIIPLGSDALYATTGKKNIYDYRGSILRGINGLKVIPTFDIGNYLYAKTDLWEKYVAIFDFKRAAAHIDSPNWANPSRLLRVCRNSGELYDFIHRKVVKGKKFKLSVDIEAKDCIPVCIGIAFDKHEGMTIPLWNKNGFSTIPEGDLANIWILLAQLLYHEDALIIGQNFKYDQDKIERLGFFIRFLYGDTMLKAQAINPEMPKGLAFNTSIFTEEPFYKNEGMYEGSIEDLFIGCARDACVTMEVFDNMDKSLDQLTGQRAFYENFLMLLHDSYLKSERIGFRINDKLKLELIEKYVKWSERLNYELFCLAGAPINVSSPKQVALLLYENWKIPQRAGTGEEVLTSLLANVVKDENKRRGIEIILEKRRVDKTISTYLMALPDYDGRMKTTFFLCLNTGRTSTGQQDPPIRPEIQFQAKGKKVSRVMGQAFQTMTKHGDIGADVRMMYIVDEGEVFVNIDSSQAEARVVFLLANDEEALELIDKHDYHALTASWFFGKDENAWSKKTWGYEHPIRFCGKTLRHACHLGASKATAATTVNTDARKYKIKDDKGNLFTISEKFAGEAIEIFHYKQPSIRNNFHHGIQAALAANNRRIIAGLPYGVNCDYGGLRTFHDRWGDELFRGAYSYIPQRSITDNTKAAKLRIESRLQGIKTILESHDALLFSIRVNEMKEVIPILQEEMERPISFKNCTLPRRDLIIPSEVEIGDNYKELNKYKG